MNSEGPPLALLTRRLAQCPPEAWDPASLAAAHVEAVVQDVLLDLGEQSPAPLPPVALESNARSWALVGAWLLREPWFVQRASPASAQAARDWLQDEIPTLSQVLEARESLSDADRREEVARRALSALGLRPEGETPTQAADRLKTLDSIERQKVILEARRSQERARQIREEMARRAAEEAAARYGRE
jgi:hypothetical protein